MAAYRRVYDFGHLRADCRGPGSGPEPYARFEYGTTFTFTLPIDITPAKWRSANGSLGCKCSAVVVGLGYVNYLRGLLVYLPIHGNVM